MLCTRCNKRQAVVFITGVFGGEKTENAGLCLTCARELGIPQVENIIRQMGLTDQAIQDMEDQLAEFTADDDSPMSALLNVSESGIDTDSLPGDLSEMLFPGSSSDNGDEYDEDDGDEEDDEEAGAAEPQKGEQTPVLKGEPVEPEKESDADSDTENDEDSRPNHFPSPFEQLFGGSFQPGGATYSDKKGKKNKKEKAHKRKFLDNYCTNLTARAREGKIDHIVGRDKEIERIIQILSRRQKNNPCLIGEPGVGKTAIAEGLALRICDGTVPQRLATKELYLLDLTALVAGTQFRGQFESRIKGLIDEIKAVKNAILFIDEVHNLVGTGDAEGSMSAANILKPALSRGELQVIGATTFTEYRKHIEKDSALERRFQPVKIDEPSISDTITVLKGIKSYYEEHHGVQFSDVMVVRAVNLSERYITDRFLPDKAIDLMDEACACAALRNKAREEMQRLQAELDAINAEAEADQQQMDNPEYEPDYERMAQQKSQRLRLENRISELKPEAESCEVTEADLAKVIELWTGVQASRVEQSEYSKLAGLAEHMKQRIKGQDEAVELVASAIRRSRVQISPRRRPASFIFVGPTGVGKTELVKVLASELFDTPETLIRLDMSEFMEKHSVSRIIGSPPGYVGYDEAGQLTEKVRRKPYSVLLFDEIEKAHPDVMNILLQILDEGKINDAQGRTVSFENTVIIMTSNAGSNLGSTALGFAKTEGELAKERALKALSDFLRPEFLARVDEIVCFNPLSDDDFREIARLMCSEYTQPLAEKGIELVVTDEAISWLAQHARSGKSAARDLRNLIRRELEDKLAQMIIEYAECPPTKATVSAADDKLTITAE